MAIKHHSPTRSGVFWPPYSAEEKRQMDAIDSASLTAGLTSSGYPYARGEGPNLPSRNAAAASCGHQSSNRGDEPIDSGG